MAQATPSHITQMPVGVEPLMLSYRTIRLPTCSSFRWTGEGPPGSRNAVIPSAQKGCAPFNLLKNLHASKADCLGSRYHLTLSYDCLICGKSKPGNYIVVRQAANSLASIVCHNKRMQGLVSKVATSTPPSTCGMDI